MSPLEARPPIVKSPIEPEEEEELDPSEWKAFFFAEDLALQAGNVRILGKEIVIYLPFFVRNGVRCTRRDEL